MPGGVLPRLSRSREASSRTGNSAGGIEVEAAGAAILRTVCRWPSAAMQPDVRTDAAASTITPIGNDFMMAVPEKQLVDGRFLQSTERVDYASSIQMIRHSQDGDSSAASLFR